MKNGGRAILIIISAILILTAVLEAGILYRMVSTVIRGESPRQLLEKGSEEPPEITEDFTPAGNTGGADAGKRLSEAGDIGPYHIEIGEAVLTEDAEGEPAVIFSYTWSNNSEAAASAMVMLIERAYQGDGQLASAQVEGSASYDPDAAARPVQPGGALTVQRAFRLNDDSRKLEFEVSEFLSRTKDAVTKEYDLSNLFNLSDLSK